jgi:hypothetical protein
MELGVSVVVVAAELLRVLAPLSVPYLIARPELKWSVRIGPVAGTGADFQRCRKAFSSEPFSMTKLV